MLWSWYITNLFLNLSSNWWFLKLSVPQITYLLLTSIIMLTSGSSWSWYYDNDSASYFTVVMSHTMVACQSIPLGVWRYTDDSATLYAGVTIVVPEQHFCQTIIQSDATIVTLWQPETGSQHDYTIQHKLCYSGYWELPWIILFQKTLI